MMMNPGVSSSEEKKKEKKTIKTNAKLYRRKLEYTLLQKSSPFEENEA
jgi:hypothetical protein